MRTAMIVALGTISLTGQALAQALPHARPFSDYLQTQYTADERRCAKSTDVQSGWCYLAASKLRDAEIRKLVAQSANPAVRRYQASWLVLREAHCDAAAGDGSGAGTIKAECILDMTIAHQFELERVIAEQ
jgi:uncharacterized protein YecT (DUF1311 family)